ncbi:MAG: head-tail connector protein [Clostridia bacterium]|nr:head-tail connector protein [Clostridia bacterium]
MVVSVDEVKAHLRIEQDEEDEYITRLIAAAQAAAEDYCRVSFEPETVVDEGGNESTAPVPEPVRLAILLMVSFHYENRDIPDVATYNATKRAFYTLLYPYRDPMQMF